MKKMENIFGLTNDNKESDSKDKIERKTSLRIKVTEKCPWNCSFCHNDVTIAAIRVTFRVSFSCTMVR